MKLISWNVNGIRACVQKGFLDFFKEVDADIFCIQESKMQAGQLDLELDGYYQYWNYAEKKGYSGTAIFSKEEPLSVTYGLNIEEHDHEGRVITAEYPKFFLVTCYTPNAQRGLARLDHRMRWDEAFRSFLMELDRTKPVIICGDLNVAHQEIDLKNPASNRGNAGFTDFAKHYYRGVIQSTLVLFGIDGINGFGGKVYPGWDNRTKGAPERAEKAFLHEGTSSDQILRNFKRITHYVVDVFDSRKIAIFRKSNDDSAHSFVAVSERNYNYRAYPDFIL